MVKTATIKLLNRKVKIVLPRFSLGFTKLQDKDGVCDGVYIETTNEDLFGCVREFTYIKDDYRHISIAELVELMDCNNEQKKEIFAQLYLAYLLLKGIDLKDEYSRCGIYLSDGIRREGENLIIFKNIDGKLDCVTEDTYNTIVGYKIKDNTELQGERFSLKRLFRKYTGENITLKEIDKSNSDLIEYLFSREYEGLSEVIQKARFILPPDTCKKESKECGWSKCNICPLCIDISSELLLKQLDNTTASIDISGFKLKELTIDPYQMSCGLHFLVKEI